MATSAVSTPRRKRKREGEWASCSPVPLSSPSVSGCRLWPGSASRLRPVHGSPCPASSEQPWASSPALFPAKVRGTPCGCCFCRVCFPSAGVFTFPQKIQKRIACTSSTLPDGLVFFSDCSCNERTFAPFRLVRVFFFFSSIRLSSGKMMRSGFKLWSTQIHEVTLWRSVGICR